MAVETGTRGQIKTELIDGTPVARLLISNPANRNAVTYDMLQEFQQALAALDINDSVKVVIVSGEGADVTSGWDLSEVYEVFGRFPGGEGMAIPSQRARIRYLSQLWGRSGLYTRYMQLHKLTIFEAKGMCLDIGLYLALCSDIVIATPDLQIGNPRWLLAGAEGDLRMLAAAVGLRRAKQLVYVENVVDADRAKEIKLVEMVVPSEKLEETVMALAKTLSGIPRDNIFTAKDNAGGQFVSGMAGAQSRATGLSNVLYRDGEFNFLRERRNRGLAGAMEAAQRYARGEPID
jgi:enoyl-CoA hydratase/carnithine racemase